MAARETVGLDLAGETFKVRPLTLVQVEAFEEIVLAGGDRPIAQAKRLLKVALARDHGGVDVEALEATPQELAVAMPKLLRHAGFLPGEAPAAAGATAPHTTAPAPGESSAAA